MYFLYDFFDNDQNLLDEERIISASPSQQIIISCCESLLKREIELNQISENRWEVINSFYEIRKK